MLSLRLQKTEYLVSKNLYSLKIWFMEKRVFIFILWVQEIGLLKNKSWVLERCLSVKSISHFQRTWKFPASTWHVIMDCNSSSRESEALFCSLLELGMYVVMHRQNSHMYKIFKALFLLLGGYFLFLNLTLFLTVHS